MPAILASFVVLAVVLAGLYGALPYRLPAIAALTVWGAAAFTLTSPLQMRVVDEATDAPNLAATLNQGAFNLGNAAGAWLGGLALSAGWSFRDLPLLSAGVAVVALGVAAFSYWLDRTHLVRPELQVAASLSRRG
jgi:DHA1 family inner membrane transport protein